MKIRILVAVADSDYLERLTRVMSEKYADLLEVTACSSESSLSQLLQRTNIDVALVDTEFAEVLEPTRVKMMILLWDGKEDVSHVDKRVRLAKKYQRISSITSSVLECYAALPSAAPVLESGAPTTVVWSPAGGCGKTTAALAYAAQRAANGKKVVYLDLEPFSSVDVYFSGNGKSISGVFEQLDANPELLLKSVQMQDSGSSIYFFNKPDNYDDMNELTAEDVLTLVRACARSCDEVVVDYSSACDTRLQVLFDVANAVLLVVDGSRTCQKKWEQFCTQHSVFASICEKATLVKNRGAGKMENYGIKVVVDLPGVQSADPTVVYKTLSGGYFAG